VKAFEARTGGADAAVGGGPPNGGAAFAARMRDNVADEIGGDTEQECGEDEQRHL
jgi:hypothetical protein